MRTADNMEFVSLLQNERFLKRVEETLSSEDQIEILESEFSGSRVEILHALEFVRIHLEEQRRMPLKEVSEILDNIRKQTKERKSSSRFDSFVHSGFWRVAALLIIILTLTVILFKYKSKTDQLEKIAATEAAASDEAMIILSDGSKHKLGLNDSRIEYKSDGGEVVIKKDKQEEKIENPASSFTAINQIIVPFGHRHEITLSDGTQVQLNSGSRLVFPARFSGKERMVYLKGEGYFEVTKDPGKPFIVKTEFIDVKVLGTVFNISAYEDEKMTTTVLLEGRVIISEKNNKSGNTDKKLIPGQGYFYDSPSFTSEIKEVQPDEYTSWKDGVLLLRDKPLEQVISRVEKYYNKRIQVNGDRLAKTLIHGKLVLSEDLDEVVSYLAKTVEGEYIKNADGSFTIKTP